MKETSQHHERFDLLRKVYKLQDFKLELHVDIWVPGREYAVKALKAAVAAEKARGGFDDSFPEPPVISFPRSYSQDIGFTCFVVQSGMNP